MNKDTHFYILYENQAKGFIFCQKTQKAVL